jgi:nicotinamide mononucleotide (NMN) deamidase PncC
VGLVYIGLAAEDAESAEKHIWAGDRESNKAQTAEAALKLLFSYLSA